MGEKQSSSFGKRKVCIGAGIAVAGVIVAMSSYAVLCGVALVPVAALLVLGLGLGRHARSRAA